MVKIDFDEKFKRTVSKIKDGLIKERIDKLIVKIIARPTIGKPMRNNRKGTREVYLSPYRLSYAYDRNNDTIIILAIFLSNSENKHIKIGNF